MHRIPLLILSFIIMVVAVKVPAFPEETASPHQQCMDKQCSVEENLRFFNELQQVLQKDFKRIEQTCVKSGYKNCFNPASSEVTDWRKVHSRMGDLARKLETRYTTNAKIRQFNLIEPAAGPNPYTNPDQEQLDNNKKDWWQGGGWSPPQESNPYHKW